MRLGTNRKIIIVARGGGAKFARRDRRIGAAQTVWEFEEAIPIQLLSRIDLKVGSRLRPVIGSAQTRGSRGGNEMDGLQMCVEALRLLSKQPDSDNRQYLAEKRINEYLGREIEALRASLERLEKAIDDEVSRGGDWGLDLRLGVLAKLP